MSAISRYRLAALAGILPGLLAAGQPLSHVPGEGPSAARELPLVADSAAEAAIARRVEIVRTEYGVPHVLAQDLEAMGFAMGWLQSEDYGDVAARELVKARGTYARFVGRDSIDGDFESRVRYARARETWDQLSFETQQVYDGFAAGIRHYVRLHPGEFPDWLVPDFTGLDAHARDVQTWSRGDARSFVAALEGRRGGMDADAESFDLDGSNAWAFGPSRSMSGNAMLLRNPHLGWDAGYYEAHVKVPGVVEFYGDFRIGHAFGIIGGFNEHLGWATTNNSPTLSQVYALSRDPEDATRYLLDGVSHPVVETPATVPYRTIEGSIASETRTTLMTPYGPVIHQTRDTFYVLKDPRDGEFRRGEQFLRMMQATSLPEWLDVMRMRAHPTSNFTYADAAGNIAHYYNARLPALPHAPTGDAAAPADSSADIWSELVAFEDLPLWVNPPGGYVQQANDTPDYTNLLVTLDRDTVPANLPEPRLRLRSQHSLLLAHGSDRLTPQDVMALKHSDRILLANRIVDELVVEARKPVNGIRPSYMLDAAVVLENWDRTSDIHSRGGTLFSVWAEEYAREVDDESFFRIPWDPEFPLATPYGIGDPAAAVRALKAAIDTMQARRWPVDVTWGEVHRVVRGDVDAPVAGCPATLGCFRVLSFEMTDDRRLAANRGDAWVLLVEFGDTPRAWSVLAYGESNREGTPHFDDQAGLFAGEQFKPVAWTEAEIAARALRRYRPGEETDREEP